MVLSYAVISYWSNHDFSMNLSAKKDTQSAKNSQFTKVENSLGLNGVQIKTKHGMKNQKLYAVKLNQDKRGNLKCLH